MANKMKQRKKDYDIHKNDATSDNSTEEKTLDTEKECSNVSVCSKSKCDANTVEKNPELIKKNKHKNGLNKTSSKTEDMVTSTYLSFIYPEFIHT